MTSLEGQGEILSDAELANTLAFHDFWCEYLRMLEEEAEADSKYEEESLRTDFEARDRDIYAYHGVCRHGF